VRVQRDRVRALDASKCLLAPHRQLEEPAVRRVDVVPQVFLCGDVGDGVERIHHAGVDGSGRCHDKEWSVAAPPVIGYGGTQCVWIHPQPGVAGDDAYRRGR
jgi:hypothetical protein